MIDTEEVAYAIKEMFEASASAGEPEPDTDLIVDILHEHFPGLSMAQLQEATIIFRSNFTGE